MKTDAVTQHNPTKRCYKCGSVKHLGCFNIDRYKRDGHQGECRECANSFCREYRRKIRERTPPEEARKNRSRTYLRYRESELARARRYVAAHREKSNGVKKAWAERNPEKVRAHIVVREAVKYGRIVKGPCSDVLLGGCTCQITAHHHDYAKPLEVEWLCTFHHGARHRKYFPVNQTANQASGNA